MFCLLVKSVHYRACSAHGGQKRASGPLELEPQMVVATMLVLGIAPRSSGREQQVVLTAEPSRQPCWLFLSSRRATSFFLSSCRRPFLYAARLHLCTLFSLSKSFLLIPRGCVRACCPLPELLSFTSRKRCQSNWGVILGLSCLPSDQAEALATRMAEWG